MADTRPLALVTNDDGIDSPFLPVLLEALSIAFRVRFVVPLREQSWIGRALSRHRDVTVAPTRVAAFAGWSVDGTPTDCVNVALGHLLGKDRPAVVVSGLNIGYNISLPMILSSGTLAGAIEGVHWRIPALAASQALSREHFVRLQENRSEIPPAIAPAVRAACAHAAEIARKIAHRPVTTLEVHNLNYPPTMRPETPVRMTIPAEVHGRSLFQPVAGQTFRFAYDEGSPGPTRRPNDRDALEDGVATWSRLNFSSLAGSIELPI